MKLPERFWLRLALVVVSGLMFFSIFMPTLAMGTKDKKTTVSAYQYMKGMSITDEQYAKLDAKKDKEIAEVAAAKRLGEMQDKLAEAASSYTKIEKTVNLGVMKAENAFLVVYSILTGVMFVLSILLACGLLSKLLRKCGIALSVVTLVEVLITTIMAACLLANGLVSVPHFALIFGIIASIATTVLFALSVKKAKKTK